MVALRRPGIGSLGLVGQVLLVVAAVSVTLLVIIWNSFLACRNARLQSAPPHGGAPDQEIIIQQNAVLRNMTQRIQTAEQALLRLLAKRATANSKHTTEGGRVPAIGASAATAAPTAPVAGGLASSLEAGDASGFDKDEAAAEAAEQEEAEKQQRVLIQYDENTKTFLRWRPDFKCGSAVPLLPDEDVVQCNPSSDAPCCSSLGWCGKTKLHCKCQTCIDYRLEKRG